LKGDQLNPQWWIRAGSGECVLHFRLNPGWKRTALPVAEIASIILVVELGEVSGSVDGKVG
jgi:hypothetical protein